MQLDAHVAMVTRFRQRRDSAGATDARHTADLSNSDDQRRSSEEAVVQRQVSCECGYQVKDADEDALVQTVQRHVSDNHPELVDQVTPEMIKGWIELVP